MEQIFISYSSKDVAEVNEICKVLANKNLQFFKAPESLSSVSNYGREVPGAIKNCSVFLMFISKYSQESPWAIKELECAIDNKKEIVPVQISVTPLNDRLYFYLSNVQVIKYYENPESGMEQILQRLGVDEVYMNNMADDSVNSSVTAEESNVENTEKKKNDIIRRAANDDEVERPKIVNPFLQETKVVHSRSIEMSTGAGRREEYDSKMHRHLALRNNMISENQIPIECSGCKGDLTRVADGIFQCVSCGELAYDSFRKVRNYIDENGASPVTQIANDTGVSRVTVEKFLLGERLEIPVWSPVTLSCADCGVSIRTGMYCSACKQKKELKPVSREKDSTNAVYRFRRDIK